MGWILRTAGLTVAAAFLCGCGGDAGRSAAPSTNEDALKDLAQMLKLRADQNQPPPGKLADLDAVEPLIPLAGPTIRAGEVIYLWGAGYAAGSTKIAAHDKDALSVGGWVLLQDGTVKQMTAAEFASAPKAGKK